MGIPNREKLGIFRQEFHTGKYENIQSLFRQGFQTEKMKKIKVPGDRPHMSAPKNVNNCLLDRPHSQSLLWGVPQKILQIDPTPSPYFGESPKKVLQIDPTPSPYLG